MLHDPRHDKNPTLAGFALFVASQPADERYDWPNCSECAVGRYLKSIDRKIPLSEWVGELAVMNHIAQGLLPSEEYSSPERWTFGQLADRIFEHQIAQTVAV